MVALGGTADIAPAKAAFCPVSLIVEKRSNRQIDVFARVDRYEAPWGHTKQSSLPTPARNFCLGLLAVSGFGPKPGKSSSGRRYALGHTGVSQAGRGNLSQHHELARAD